MTTMYDGAHIFLECEECPETTESYGRDDFDTMIAEAKAAGWHVYLAGHRWEHKCPLHKHGDRLAAAQRLFGS